MSLVHNERTKLTATWFSGLGIAFMAAGLFAPLAALAYGLAELKINAIYAAVIVAVCIGTGLTLHVVGRRFLGRLDE